LGLAASLSGLTTSGRLAALALANAAVEEMFTFLPDGAEEMPESAFWSQRGRDVRAAGRNRFRRKYLMQLCMTSFKAYSSAEKSARR
jgi:hypothetical protein